MMQDTFFDAKTAFEDYDRDHMQTVNLLDLKGERIIHESADDALIGLDEPDEWSAFSKVVNHQNWESHLAIEGMHCAACGLNVEKAVKDLPGVVSIDANATTGRARLVWSADKIKPSIWMNAINRAGYRVLPAADVLLRDNRRKNQRRMLWRLLVAGFCMMQVMMYTMPTYYASPGEMSPDTLNLLRWASWVLTLPVMFFSSGPFFKSALTDIRQRQISMDLPVSLGIVIAFLVSTAATFEPNGWWGSEVYFDSLTMLVFFLLTGRWIELRMRDKTAGALDVLMRRLPSTIARKNVAGQFERVAVRRLNLGDVVRVLPGEAFPADGKISLGETNADESLLTGESRPVLKALGDEVIAGSHNLSSAVEVNVEKIGETTRYAQIVALMERASVDKPRLAILADRIAQPFLILVLLAAAFTAFYLWHVDHSRALMTAVAVLIVTCPCALSLATPAAMLTMSGKLARSGILVRRMQALEALTNIDTIIFDKTGTLTLDRMELGAITTDKSITKTKALQLAGAMAKHSLHPVSKAIVDAASKTRPASVTNVQEVSGAGLLADSAYGKLRLGSSRFCELQKTEVENRKGTIVHLTSDKTWLASFEVLESIKADAAFSVSEVTQNNIQVEVLSGDKKSAVQKVADAVGIKHVYADCTPQDKLAHIQDLKRRGRKVLMVGDGLNDGPVLASAHVSVAMGQAVPLAQSQSDFVVMQGQLAMVPYLLAQAKQTMKIVRQNLVWAAAYNAICVPLAIAGYLPAWLAGLGMALSSLFVILNAARLAKIDTIKGLAV